MDVSNAPPLPPEAGSPFIPPLPAEQPPTTLTFVTTIIPGTPDLSSLRVSQTAQSSTVSLSEEIPGSTKETAYEIASDTENEDNEDQGTAPEVLIEPSPFPPDPLASATYVSPTRRQAARHQTLEEQLRPILAEPDPVEAESDEDDPTGMSIFDEAWAPLSRKAKRKGRKKTPSHPIAAEEETTEGNDPEITAEYWQSPKGKTKREKKKRSPKTKY